MFPAFPGKIERNSVAKGGGEKCLRRGKNQGVRESTICPNIFFDFFRLGINSSFLGRIWQKHPPMKLRNRNALVPKSLSLVRRQTLSSVAAAAAAAILA